MLMQTLYFLQLAVVDLAMLYHCVKCVMLRLKLRSIKICELGRGQCHRLASLRQEEGNLRH